jgi:hypothetical protein
LAPDKIAEHMQMIVDRDHDIVQAVTVTDWDGQMLTWSKNGTG